MNQITVRGIPPELEKRIRLQAKATGKSLNKVMLELIGGSAGPETRRKKPAGASLAELAGGWSREEAREFEESVRVFEKIDGLAFTTF
jgi:plasmid stability protein